MRELFLMLQRHAEGAGDRLAFDDGTTRLTYGALARRVAATSAGLQALPGAPRVVGLLGGNGVDWVVGQLAGWHAGKTMVPLPPFFRGPQLRHVLRDAGVGHLLTTAAMADTARLLGLPFTAIGTAQARFAPPSGPLGGQVIYTSGSAGQPKGVLLESGQLQWTARALARAIDATAEDSCLSLLPLPLLLETICAVVIPILVGAPVRLEPGLTAAFGEPGGGQGGGPGRASLAEAVATHRPSCLVLVPQLLAGWLAELRAGAERPPESLRVVAVGGAAVPVALAEQAWAQGVPVYEGYGLSECGSVVAFNCPGERRPGTVGRPLPGLEVDVEGGEIVVAGPPLMDRYLSGEPLQGPWRTGDVGEFDADGFLTVHGRLDNRIVLPLGRNVSPEWIEALLAADWRVAYGLVTHAGGPHLTAILVPSARGEAWFARAASAEIEALVADCCREVPAYAVPRRVAVLAAQELGRDGLVTGNGRLRRREVLQACRARFGFDRAASPDVLWQETQP
ncbi:Acyl-CoA synthetase (AMP-forming)/AMP-acid ligase II [Tistlia consotensis]|uniref:Acyl-CoA synthetase (AMP-forming)/AMP-acid ligase II n=1 Tax=Tistlia consotensis USBA 355 TaxID=560819 RepID=A0A1Y6CEJ2_9PROT|nr:AMP-binding protein [Tistlia consotensis]SMF60149.1 Acyl-CoA synthetase (AMP-forming)/AMP-acid ligase II [Tistlia consotensis USBA 355]SNR93786.1 Acyl-CoA synthetase (AMP-forming)/AMP-acid ligase II [Tistlia consotensis]